MSERRAATHKWQLCDRRVRYFSKADATSITPPKATAVSSRSTVRSHRQTSCAGRLRLGALRSRDTWNCGKDGKPARHELRCGTGLNRICSRFCCPERAYGGERDKTDHRGKLSKESQILNSRHLEATNQTGFMRIFSSTPCQISGGAVVVSVPLTIP